MATVLPYPRNRSAVSVRLPGNVGVGVERAGDDRDRRALGGESLGDGGADAPAGAGDDGPPADEPTRPAHDEPAGAKPCSCRNRPAVTQM